MVPLPLYQVRDDGLGGGEQKKKADEYHELGQACIPAHIQYPVARMIIDFYSTLFAHGNGLFVEDQSFGLVIDMITGRQDPGAPVPLFIIDKEVFGEYPHFIDHLAADEHGAAVCSVGIAGNIALSPVDLFAADGSGPAGERIDGIETGILYHVGLLKEADLGAGDADGAVLKKRLYQYIQQFGRHFSIIIYDKNIVTFCLTDAPVIPAGEAEVLFAP